MSEDFMAVKEGLDIIDVARRYGVQVVRGNKAHCPFHTDRTPSMSFYDNNQRFHCFSCEAGGDAVDLVGRLLNLSSQEALRLLNNDYRLGLDLDTPPSSEKVRRAVSKRKQIQRERELFQRWESGSQKILSAYFRTLREWKQRYAPDYPGQPLHPRFVEALQCMDYIDYLLDAVFINGTKEEKSAFMKSHERIIRLIEQRLMWEGISYAHGSEAGAVEITGFRPVVIAGGLRPTAAA